MPKSGLVEFALGTMTACELLLSYFSRLFKLLYSQVLIVTL